jgi:hypothetical protein
MTRPTTRHRFAAALSTVLAFAALLLPTTAHAADTSWVEASDAHAQVLLRVLAEIQPEAAGQFGVEGLDEEIFQLPPDATERQTAAIERAIAELEKRLAKETVPQVRQDLEIMLTAARDGIAEAEVNDRHMLPYFNLPQTIFIGVQGILDQRVDPERHGAALVRLRRYTGLEEGYTPITEQVEAYIRARFDRGLQGPFRGQLERDLGNSARFVEGGGQLFEAFGVEGGDEALAAFESQVADWDEFVTEEIVPRASDDFRLPEEVYARNLHSVGVDMDVDELQARAKASFREIQNEMQALAERVAAERGFPSSDYRDVIRELKKEQIVGEAILPHYQQRMADIEKLIETHGIATLPERDAVIRLATEAESASIPAPHMSPPRLIGNTGEVGEFVLPLNIPGEDGEDLEFDDFTFDAASWTLTVHEGRPGHEMQWSALVENGVSIARALFAFNSVNAEGWALYTEGEMKPYLPLDGQLISLQHRLLRAARAHLDPGLQLGTITREEAMRVLQEDVVNSPAMAMQEVERYTFWAPGQATAYFTGYQRLLELRTNVERKLGDAFDKKKFHDFILAQGLLPPSLLRKAVMEEFVPGLRKADAEG